MKKLSYVIIDGQWGSTGKGLIAGYLATKVRPDTAVCNFGPNAGHTVVMPDGREVMTQMLPSAIVSPHVKTILIGPGAIVDPKILKAELDKYDDLVKDKRIFIHDMATIIKQEHKDREAAELNRISSTCKGTGAAQTDKVMRIEGAVARDCADLPICAIRGLDFTRLLQESQILQIESAQGLELGLNSGGWYPYCTSRDVNVHQVLSDCAIPYSFPRSKVVVSMRTYPIRVGNAFDSEGNLIGTSGPVYPDQEEVTWEQLGQKVERTTVTKKIRRVFTWSHLNFEKVITMLNPDAIFLNFVNYYEENPTFVSPITRSKVYEIEQHYNRCILTMGDTGPIIRWIGTGPKITDVLQRRDNNEFV